MYDFVIVGASKAGCSVASKLLAAKKDHSILLVNGEDNPPYDKPPLSKEVLHGGKDSKDFPLLTDSELSDPRLTVLSSTQAQSVDYEDRVVSLSCGGRVSYKSLVVATGARAHQPFGDVPEQVVTLRNDKDAEWLRRSLRKPSRLVIIGGGFIGFEVASSARKMGAEVTIVEIAPVPLARGAGPQVGAYLSSIAEKHGVRILTASSVRSFDTVDGKLTAVVLANGERIPCDICLVGVGSVPNTEWLGDFVSLERGALPCDESGKVLGLEHVFAVGDVSAWREGATAVRHEHWSSASDQASRLVSKILDDVDLPKTENYIWSDQFDRRVSLYGETGGNLDSANLVVSGSNPELGIGFYRDGLLVGTCVIGTPKDALLYRKALFSEKLATVT